MTDLAGLVARTRGLVERSRADARVIVGLVGPSGAGRSTVAQHLEAGVRPSVTSSESAELRELKRRNRLMEQDSEGCAGLRRKWSPAEWCTGPGERVAAEWVTVTA